MPVHPFFTREEDGDLICGNLVKLPSPWLVVLGSGCTVPGDGKHSVMAECKGLVSAEAGTRGGSCSDCRVLSILLDVMD